MSLSVVTAASIEPITVQEAKDQLRLETDLDDDLLRAYIKTAREWVEGQTKRALAEVTYDYAIDYEWPVYCGVERITLPVNPVSSVTSITYIDNNGASQTLAANQYIVNARKHTSYIAPAYDVEWPDVRAIPGCITVRFVAGAADADDIPSPLKQAIRLMVAEFYEQRTLTSGRIVSKVPFGVEALISPYRNTTL